MASTTSVLFRLSLPGGGHTSAGIAKNNKELVVARVVCTDVQSGLETFTATNLGLETIDVLYPFIESATGGVPGKTATTSVHVDWDQANTRFVISDVAQAGDRAAITNDEDPVIRVMAVGDSARAPDLV